MLWKREKCLPLSEIEAIFPRGPYRSLVTNLTERPRLSASSRDHMNYAGQLCSGRKTGFTRLSQLGPRVTDPYGNLFQPAAVG
jgi:hypothetical protein